jgi:putative transposase
MKKSGLKEERMVKILREAYSGPVAEVAKHHGISDATIYAWRKRYGKLSSEGERSATFHGKRSSILLIG